MIKRISLRSLSLFFTLAFKICFAQQPTVQWGKEMVKPRQSDITRMIGRDKKSFYCLRSRASFFSYGPAAIEKYSQSTLSLEYVKEFKIPEVQGKKLNFEEIVLLKGNLLAFFSRYDGDQDKNIVYVQKISPENGTAIGEPKEIDYITAFKKRNKGSFGFVLSEDSTKLLILHNEHYDRYSNEKFSYKLIDDKASELWSVSLELPYRDKYFTIDNYAVSNEGKVYMLAKIMKEKEDRERKKPSYRYDLISYDYAKKELNETEIKVGDKFISDAGFGIGPNNTIMAGGFYSNKSEDGLAGVFFVTIDKDNKKIVSQGSKDFSAEFLGGLMSERRAGKHKELYYYKIDHMVLRSDGSFDMIAEQYYVHVVTNYNPRGVTTTTYHYYYNDIIVASVSPDASINWIKAVPKFQHSTDDGGYFSSYSFCHADGNLYFIYNENPKNLAKPKKYPRNGISRKMVTVMAKMDDKGNVEKKALFSAKTEKIYTRPKVSLQLNDNQALFYAIKRKKFKFGIITY